jgi:ZIP family zinc transporter
MWMIYLAVATHLIGDGLLIGAGTSVSAGLGIILALDRRWRT